MQFITGEFNFAGYHVFAIGVNGNGTAEHFGLVPDIGQSDTAGCFAGTVKFGGLAWAEHLVQPVLGDEAAGIVDVDV